MLLHYDLKDKEAKEKFYNVVKDKEMEGIALDNCVAIEYIDGKTKIIKSNPNKNAYKVIYDKNNEKIIEEKMD